MIYPARFIYFLLPINLLFAFNICLSQNIKISANFPDSIQTGANFDTEFTIEKGGISSFAKFQVDIPSGFYASPVDIHAGNWTFEQQRAKIVWVSVPSESSFIVKINFKSSSSTANTVLFTVKFFYLENNVKKEFDLTPYAVKLFNPSELTQHNSTDNVTKNQQEENTQQQTVNKTENTYQEESVSKAEINNQQTTAETVQKNNLTPSNSSSNILFRVQLGAFSTKPPLSKYKGMKDVWMYEENGLHKVTVGKFINLQEAEKYKAELRTKGIEGFVVEFDNGVHVKIH